MIDRVIRFTAQWCAPCKAFAPTFDKVAANDKFNNITFDVIDVEEDIDALGEKLQIRAVPTVVLMNGDELVNKIIGVVSENELTKIIADELSNG